MLLFWIYIAGILTAIVYMVYRNVVEWRFRRELRRLGLGPIAESTEQVQDLPTPVLPPGEQITGDIWSEKTAAPTPEFYEEVERQRRNGIAKPKPWQRFDGGGSVGVDQDAKKKG